MSDTRGGGHVLEWMSALALVLGLAFALTIVGRNARHRIAGDEGRDGVGITGNIALGGSRDYSPAVLGASPSSENGRANDDDQNRNDDENEYANPRDVDARCEEGFVRGAARAFMEGDGEVVGDLVGLKDAQLKEWLWDRPAGEVLAAAGRGAANAAPGLMSAAPGLIASATWSALARVQEDPTGTATSVLSVLFVDSFRTVGTLAVDGWHGSGVLIASARSGDCVAFGRTLRSGVNNAPEMALSLADVVPLTVGMVKLGPKMLRSAKLASLAKAAMHLGDNTVGAGLRGAASVGTAVASPTRLASLASRTGSAARVGLGAGGAAAASSVQGGLRAARELASDTGASVGRIAQHVGSGDVRGAAREVTREVAGMGRATVAALASASAATKVGVVSVVHAVEGAGTSRFATLGESFTGRHALSAEQHAYAGLGVCVAGRCGGRSERGLCFTAGTPVETSKGNVAIETLRVGDRVATTGVRSSSQRETRVDETWRVITLELERSAGDVVRIELLRSPEWLAQTRAHAGGLIALSLPEMELEGPARVTKISDSAQIEEGSGHVVLATFESEAKDVLELRFENESEVLEPTWRHRLYSIDRREWVAAGKLRVGERLRTRTGDAVIASIRAKPGVHTVYNLEVETDHSYFVGNIGALSHNQTPYAPNEGWPRSFQESVGLWPELFPAPERPSFRGKHPFQGAYREDALRTLAMAGDDDAMLDRFTKRIRTLEHQLLRSQSVTDELEAFVREMDMRTVFRQGELLAQRYGMTLESTPSVPRFKPEVHDLLLWARSAGVPAAIDEPMMRKFIAERQGIPFVTAVTDAQQGARELARLVHLRRSNQSDVFVAARYETAVARQPELEQAVVNASLGMHSFVESELVARQLVRTGAWDLAPDESVRALVDDVIEWKSPSNGDGPRSIETLALERHIRQRLARMTEQHLEVANGRSFLQGLKAAHRSLQIEAPPGARVDQQWLLSTRDSAPRLRPFDPERGAQRGTVVLDSLFLDEQSIATFVRYIIQLGAP